MKVILKMVEDFTRYQVISARTVLDRIGKARVLARQMIDVAQVLKQQWSL